MLTRLICVSLESIYKCLNVVVLPTSVIDDEYVIVVLEIMSEELRAYYGGKYLIQQWSQKSKIFQAVHSNEPQSFFLHQQRFIYSLRGTDSECSYLYISNFYQSIFQKIKHPFYHPDNQDGIHDISLYVDPKQVLVVNGEKIVWSQLKIENLVAATPAGGATTNNISSMNLSDDFLGFDGVAGLNFIVESDVNFIDVLDNCDSEDKPDDVQKIFFVCILDFQAEKRNQRIDLFVTTHFAFDKQSIKIGINESYKSITLQNYADQENLVVLHLESGQIKIYNEAIMIMMEELKKQVKAEEESDSTDEEELARRETLRAQRQKFFYRVTRACRKEEPIPESRKKKDGNSILENQTLNSIKNFFLSHENKNFLRVSKYFVRRQQIYLLPETGQIKRININQIQNADAIQKAVKIKYPIEVAMLQDVVLHINLYNDFLMTNTTLILSHQKILSIYDFLTKQWRHMLPQEQGNKNQEMGQTYFGMPADEIEQLMLNYVYPNNIYDCIIKYRGKFIRRLKYYNNIDRQFFERVSIFEKQKVLQIQRNVDIKNYRQYGDQTIRTLFLVEDLQMNVNQIWVSENASRITKLVDRIPLGEQWQLVEIPNARGDMLIVYSKTKRTMTIYNIPNSKQCLYPEQLLKYKTHEVERFVYEANDKISYFLFFNKMYYQQKGNLMVLDISQKFNRPEEISFNGTIKDFYMTHQDSIYYKDKNNIFRFAHIGIQKVFNVDKQPTEVTNCRGAFCTKLEYGPSTNRIALFTSSFEISVYPLLDRCRLDLIASQDFSLNYICWKEVGNKLIALKKPNILVTWNIDSGKIEDYHTFESVNFSNFSRHTEWNGATLLKQIKEAKATKREKPKRPPVNKKQKKFGVWGHESSDKARGDGESDNGKESYEDEDESFNDSFDLDEIEQQEANTLEKMLLHSDPSHHIYELIEIVSPTEIKQHCQFLHDFVPGQYLYVSYPYLLVMDETCSKFYVIEGKQKLKNIRLLNTFFEQQMKVSKPLYFSPNFYHRIFIDPQTKEIVINFTLTNTNIFQINLRRDIMFQIEKTHPMIYFHDNDSIVYLTIHGVEKKLQIEKTMGYRRKKASCRLVEISNVYFNQKKFIRRFILDPLRFNDQQASQMEKLDILKFRGDILKRNLYFNVYLNSNTEDKEHHISRFFSDKNISSFNHFIINNYRQELTFNYFSWKIIETMGKKKIHLKDLKHQYIQELSYSILPDHRNILHMLSENFDVLDSFIQYVTNENIEDVLQNDIEMSDILFSPDLEGKTALHYALETNNTRVVDKLVIALGQTEFDHHSRFILDIYANLVKVVPLSMAVYLQNRMKTPNWLSSYTRGRIEPENDCEFVMTADQIWKEGLDESLQSKMYQPTALEVPLEMYILDLPHLHKYQNNHADNFLEALADTDMIEIFSNNAVKALIELKWPLVKRVIKKFLFYPYLCFLLSFLIYTVYAFEEYHTANSLPQQETYTITVSYNQTEIMNNQTLPGEWKFDINSFKDPNFWINNQMVILKFLIFVFTLYFFMIESRQMFIAGPMKYLASPWNYLDVIPLVLILISMFFARLGLDPTFERPLNAIACFFMWIKFLYFWRIFRQTSKFISMIIAIIADLKVFLIVFLVTLIAFGQSLYIMSNNNEDADTLIEQGLDEDTASQQAKFITSLADSVFFAYRMSLGDFDTTQLGSVHKTLVIMMFVLSTLFLTIMMLNILIAVISDSYARVESTSIEEMYKNFADLIAENEYLIRKKFLEEHDVMGDYLFIAKLDKNEVENEIEAKLSDIQTNIVKKTDLIEKLLREANRSLSNAIVRQSEQVLGYIRDSNVKYDFRLKQCIKKIETNIKKKENINIFRVDSENSIRSPNIAPRQIFKLGVN